MECGILHRIHTSARSVATHQIKYLLWHTLKITQGELNQNYFKPATVKRVRNRPKLNEIRCLSNQDKYSMDLFTRHIIGLFSVNSYEVTFQFPKEHEVDCFKSTWAISVRVISKNLRHSWNTINYRSHTSQCICVRRRGFKFLPAYSPFFMVTSNGTRCPHWNAVCLSYNIAMEEGKSLVLYSREAPVEFGVFRANISLPLVPLFLFIDMYL